MAYNGSGVVFINGNASSKVKLVFTGEGFFSFAGISFVKKEDFSLLDFIPFSKNRKYNIGLDENNKYPEDYIENYADMLKG